MRLPPVAAAIAALLSNPNPANFKIQLKMKNGDGLKPLSSLPPFFFFRALSKIQRSSGVWKKPCTSYLHCCIVSFV
jgi:hypothetical protein